MNIISCHAAKREYLSYQLHQFLYFIQPLAHVPAFLGLLQPVQTSPSPSPQTSNNSCSLSQWKQSDTPCNYSLQFLILTGQFLSFFHSFRGLLPDDDQYPLNQTFLPLNINDDKDFWLFIFTDLHCWVSYGFDLCALEKRHKPEFRNKFYPFYQVRIPSSHHFPQMLSFFFPQKSAAIFILILFE